MRNVDLRCGTTTTWQPAPPSPCVDNRKMTSARTRSLLPDSYSKLFVLGDSTHRVAIHTLSVTQFDVILLLSFQRRFQHVARRPHALLRQGSGRLRKGRMQIKSSPLPCMINVIMYNLLKRLEAFYTVYDHGSGECNPIAPARCKNIKTSSVLELLNFIRHVVRNDIFLVTTKQ